jgi:SAM-dependent methyltransferase/ribosomal protein S27AE
VNFGVHTATGAAAHSADPRAACGWCGHVLASDADRLPGRLRCGRCGAQTTWPLPTEAELERAYSSWYRPPGGRFASLGDRLLRRLRGQLARRLAHIAPPGPVLDVGTGDGALLDALTARGRTAVGLERRSTRDDVRAMDLTEVRERWAAIVFWHSLEHLRDPGAALERAARLLLPDGVIVVAMPNADSVQARVFGDRWLALDLPRHLVHVPAPALLARLQAVGMRPERISYLRGGQVVFGWLHGIVGTLPTRPDLYDAIRKPDARRARLSRRRRALTLTAGALALPLAIGCAVGEASMRRGGTVYVEARRA